VAVFAGGKIEVYVGPGDLGAADDLEPVIVEFIGGAKRTLDIAVQELDSMPIARAIVEARWRGVDVRMFIEQEYVKEKLKAIPLLKARPGETTEQARERLQWGPDEAKLAENRRILSSLLRSGIDVKGDYNPKTFHQKFILRDYRGKAAPTSALLSGSANFTWTDTHVNLNHIFIFRNPRVCAEYATEVAQLATGSFGRGMHGAVPTTLGVEGVPVKVLFAPDHTPELEVVKQILRCERELRFAIFTFLGSSGIDDAILSVAKAGARVVGVLDKGQARPGWIPTWLQHPNVRLLVPKRDEAFARLRKLHHKLLVVDDAIVVAGSMNYTRPANDYNDENIFVVGSPYAREATVTVSRDSVREIARHLAAEIDRIAALSEPWQP
jgi:phosphatidylserine/phosphatidylglycerophosphate/cardiolipin synthase-like enzyme